MRLHRVPPGFFALGATGIATIIRTVLPKVVCRQAIELLSPVFAAGCLFPCLAFELHMYISFIPTKPEQAA